MGNVGSPPNKMDDLTALTRQQRDYRECSIMVLVNDRWCNSGHITVKEQVCSKAIKLLVVSMRPYYLLREFTQVIVFNVYI